MTLGKIALVAVFLFVLGCSGDGGDDFEPARGASVEVSEMEALINAAVADLELQETYHEELEPREPVGRSCFEVVSGPCNPGTGPAGLPGHAVSYRDPEGRRIGLQLQLALDELQASDMVDTQKTAMKSIETITWRQLSQPSSSGPIGGGPCDESVDRGDDAGCAWQDRSAPRVGDEAGALKSEALQGSASASVAFSRGPVFALVSVSQDEDKAPGDLADDIAEALDEQIKLALSQ